MPIRLIRMRLSTKDNLWFTRAIRPGRITREYEQHQEQASPIWNLLDAASGAEFGTTAHPIDMAGAREHNRNSEIRFRAWYLIQPRSACCECWHFQTLSPHFSRKVVEMSILPQILRDDSGQDIAEYAVMLAVILVLVVGTIRLVGSNANNAFSSVASTIQ
jgi:Flp pilus assembly pilin Flp